MQTQNKKPLEADTSKGSTIHNPKQIDTQDVSFNDSICQGKISMSIEGIFNLIKKTKSLVLVLEVEDKDAPLNPRHIFNCLSLLGNQLNRIEDELQCLWMDCEGSA